jgi:hypothetical protein
MKRLIIALMLTFASIASFGQTFDPSVVVNGLKDNRLSNSNEKTSLRTEVRLPLLVRTPAMQFTFTQIESVDGDWRLTQPFSIGYSYLYTFANGVLHPDSSMTIENKFFFGAGINYGLKLSENDNITGSLPIGAIVGYARFGFFGGYDVINQKPMMGISANLLNFPFLQKTTRFSVRSGN